MNTKTYVGTSYKTETEQGTFYNFSVKQENIANMQGIGKRSEIALAIEPKREVKVENAPTHNVYAADGTHTQRELQVLISKDALMKATPDSYGNIKLTAASRKTKSPDLSNYSVFLSEKTEDGKRQFVGRGYDESLKFGETMVVGTAYKYEFGNNGEDGKSYNVNIDVEKAKFFSVDAYGNAKLGIVPYVETTPKEDGSMIEQTRYLVTEPGERRKDIEATISVHVSNPNGEKYPTIQQSTVHTVGNADVFKLVVQDRNPQKIGKDCADLVVFENDYSPEMKDMPPEERKAALGERNYVGRGWTNDPNKIHLSTDDLTAEGLSRAIENNHTIKVIAIVHKQPQVVQESHMQQITSRIQDETLKTSDTLIKVVQSAYEKKLAPPKKIANMELSQKQRDTLQKGKAIFAEGLTDKKGKEYNAYITWNKNDGKLKFSPKNPNDDTVKEVTPTKKNKSAKL
ncbi:MAG: DUF3945 domain-containing protein [Prevotellaceae bacterium]|jgi:hypothetical protein|nr:DUF3945 domain-containing protein [Prevotellaceae bacterium]